MDDRTEQEAYTPYSLANKAFNNGPKNNAVKPVEVTRPTGNSFGSGGGARPATVGAGGGGGVGGAANAYQFYNPNIPTKTPQSPYMDALNMQSDIVHGKDVAMDQIQRSSVSTQRAAQGAEDQAVDQQMAQADLSDTQKAVVGSMQDRTQNTAETELLSNLAVQRGDRQMSASKSLADQALAAHELDSIIANRESNTLAQNLQNFEEEMKYIDLTADGGMDAANKIFKATMGDSPEMQEYWDNMDFSDIQNMQFNNKEADANTNLGVYLMTQSTDQFIYDPVYDANDNLVKAGGFNFFDGTPSTGLEFKSSGMKRDGLNSFFYAMGGSIPGGDDVTSAADLMSKWDSGDLSESTLKAIEMYLNESADDFVLSESSLGYKQGVADLNLQWASGAMSKEDYDTAVAGLGALTTLQLTGGVAFEVDPDTGDVTIFDTSGKVIFDPTGSTVITTDAMIDGIGKDLAGTATETLGIVDDDLREDQNIGGYTLQQDGTVEDKDGTTYYKVDGKWYNEAEFITSQDWVDSEEKDPNFDPEDNTIDYDDPTSSNIEDWASSDNMSDDESKSFTRWVTNTNINDMDKSTIDDIMGNPEMLDIFMKTTDLTSPTVTKKTSGKQDGSKETERSTISGYPSKGSYFVRNGVLYVMVSDVEEISYKHGNRKHFGQQVRFKNVATGEISIDDAKG